MAELDDYVSEWVAIKDGKVVAVAASSTQLAHELRNRGIKRAVSQFVAAPSEGVRVGLG